MLSRAQKTSKKKPDLSIHKNSNKHNDWICLLCDNLNYSFRQRCNRCQIQTKVNNTLMIKQIVQNQNQYYQRLQTNNQYSQYFPYQLFLIIDDQPWEQTYNHTNTHLAINPQVNHSNSSSTGQWSINLYSPKGKQNVNNNWVQFLMEE